MDSARHFAMSAEAVSMIPNDQPHHRLVAEEANEQPHHRLVAEEASEVSSDQSVSEEAVDHKLSESSIESERWARWRARKAQKKERMLARQGEKEKKQEITSLCSKCLRSIRRSDDSLCKPVSVASCKTCCLLRRDSREEAYGSRCSSSSTTSTNASASTSASASPAPPFPIRTLESGVFQLPEAATVLQEGCKWGLPDAPPDRTCYRAWP
uniref:Uncharacterized protein n=1 Tax=Alexandrium monilatum TaxID=311494 RepID=A0A7S4Q7K3_9DINO